LVFGEKRGDSRSAGGQGEFPFEGGSTYRKRELGGNWGFPEEGLWEQFR